jgi:hypothetical protein
VAFGGILLEGHNLLHPSSRPSALRATSFDGESAPRASRPFGRCT